LAVADVEVVVVVHNGAVDAVLDVVDLSVDVEDGFASVVGGGDVCPLLQGDFVGAGDHVAFVVDADAELEVFFVCAV